MWTYIELYSCPLTLILGMFKHGDLTGYITLPLLNLRLNLLIDKNKNIRIVSNIYNNKWVDELSKTCMAICKNQVEVLDTLEKILVHTMFYGGLNIHGIYKNREYLISMDYVNKKRFYFRLIPSGEIKADDVSKSTLDNWLLLQFSLREGINDLLAEICRNNFEYIDRSCILHTSHGFMEITHSPGDDRALRIIPDNNPLRHVISFSGLNHHI